MLKQYGVLSSANWGGPQSTNTFLLTTGWAAEGLLWHRAILAARGYSTQSRGQAYSRNSHSEPSSDIRLRAVKCKTIKKRRKSSRKEEGMREVRGKQRDSSRL